MTALGKILAFVNLVFSLVVAGLIVFVYAARTNWKDGYEAYKARFTAVQATAKANQEAAVLAQSEANHKIKALEDALEAQKKAVEDEKKNAANSQQALTRLEQKAGQETASVSKLRAELELRNNEVGTLTSTLAAKDKDIERQIKEKNDLREAKVQAELVASSLKERNERLITDLENSTKKRSELVATETLRALEEALANNPQQLAAAKDRLNLRRGQPSRENPPPQNVEGTIKEADASGLVKISIGSDAGLDKGHTLDVYRLNPSAEYLGQIRLLDVRPTEAVGRPVNRPRLPLQVGDRVASNIVRKG